jgi:hypothetical protein
MGGHFEAEADRQGYQSQGGLGGGLSTPGAGAALGIRYRLFGERDTQTPLEFYITGGNGRLGGGITVGFGSLTDGFQLRKIEFLGGWGVGRAAIVTINGEGPSGDW